MPINLVRKNGEVTPMRNAEYLSAYYMIPKEILEKCGRELCSIPRYPHIAVRDWNAIKVIESDLFVLLIMDVYAYMSWQYIGVKGYMENYSGYDPVWRIAHCPDIWLEEMLKCGQLLRTEDLLRLTPKLAAIDYCTIEQISAIMSKIVPEALEHNGLNAVIETTIEHRCHEDFDFRASNEKTDFFRRWYHTRAKHKTVSFEALREYYYENGFGEDFDIEDPSIDIEENAVSEEAARQFLATLNTKDRSILELRLEGKTLEEIAARLGYSNHSGVIKRLRRIGQEYERFADVDFGFSEEKIV